MLPDNAPFPRILSRKRTRVSPWVELIEKEVQFTPDGVPELYHCVTQAAYVGMFVHTSGGYIPIIRQYRPSVEDYTWELPAGTVDADETPEQAARRELLEETGLESTEVVNLGNLYPDTGRIQVDAHAFYITTPFQAPRLVCEQGLYLRYVDHRELKQMIIAGDFRHSVHLSIYAAVVAGGSCWTSAGGGHPRSNRERADSEAECYNGPAQSLSARKLYHRASGEAPGKGIRLKHPKLHFNEAPCYHTSLKTYN